MTRPLSRLAALAAIVLGTLPVPVSWASEGVDGRVDGDLANVVVTARRRGERLQDVPLAVAVLPSELLANTGAFNVGRLSQLQPSLQFYSSNPRNTAVTIRGLGSPFGLTNDGIEPGVGLYVDQVYYARPAAAVLDFLDVEQVEVVRGPQGTLYGKNTTAGAINVTSRRPDFTPEATAEVTGGDIDFRQARASVSGPLIDGVLAGRLGTSYTDRRGTIYDVASHQHINEENNVGFKGQLLLRARSDLNVTLSGDYSHQNPIGFGQVYVRTGLTQRPLTRQYAALAAASGNYAPPSYNPFDRVTDLDAQLAAKQVLGGSSLLVEWKTGPGTLTSVTAWRFWTWDPASDRDFTGLPITTISENPSRQQQWSQEIRYAASGERVDYVLGVFGIHQKIDTTGVQEQGPLASRWLLSGANANDPAILDGLRSDNNIGLRSASAAVFGQLTWHVTDRLRVQPGLRVNYDEKEGWYIATVANGTHTALTPPQLSVLAPQSYDASFSDTRASGDFTTSYAITADALAYVTYARSFKSGGINLSGLPLDANNVPITADETVRPEAVNHYEAGLKTQFAGQRVTANLAAFWTEVSDFQTTVTNSQVNVIRGYLANADRVRVRGAELDLAGRPSDGLRLFAGAAFTDHEYVRFSDAPCPPELSGGTTASATHPASPAGTPGGYSPANCDISGQWLPGISRVALSYGLDYEHALPLAGRTGAIYVGVDGSYRSKFSSNASRSVYTDVGAYGLANFRAGLRGGNWDAFGWVRNAFNREYFDFLSIQSGNTGLVVGEPGEPRTYGLTVRASFR